MSGGTLTGTLTIPLSKLVIGGTGNDTNTARVLMAYGSESAKYINIGYSASVGNCAEIAWYYSGTSASTSNYTYLGFYGGYGLYIYFNNNVLRLGTTSSYKTICFTDHTHSGYAASSHTHNYAGSNSAGGAANQLLSHDTRSSTINPDTYGPTLSCHFKQNNTNGVNDGGNYFGLIHFRPYGSSTDFSGGYPHQLAFTENSNIWYRKATSSTAWGTWRKIWHSGIFDPGNYMPKSGGAFTGSVTFANNTWNVVGDDAAIGDYNAAGMLGLKSCNNALPGIGFHNDSNTLLGTLICNAGTLTWNKTFNCATLQIGGETITFTT